MGEILTVTRWLMKPKAQTTVTATPKNAAVKGLEADM